MTKNKAECENKLRLPEFDYSQAGAYFVTICADERRSLFGKVHGSQVSESDIGNIVSRCWEELPLVYSFIALDAWVLMPNHFHGILWIGNENSAKKSLSRIIAGFKSIVTSKVKREMCVSKIWQPNFYEHVIRSEKELLNIREYIANNPLNWNTDPDNPNAIETKGIEFDKYVNVRSPSWLGPEQSAKQ
jgi:putative transposase